MEGGPGQPSFDRVVWRHNPKFSQSCGRHSHHRHHVSDSEVYHKVVVDKDTQALARASQATEQTRPETRRMLEVTAAAQQGLTANSREEVPQYNAQDVCSF